MLFYGPEPFTFLFIYLFMCCPKATSHVKCAWTPQSGQLDSFETQSTGRVAGSLLCLLLWQRCSEFGWPPLYRRPLSSSAWTHCESVRAATAPELQYRPWHGLTSTEQQTVWVEEDGGKKGRDICHHHDQEAPVVSPFAQKHDCMLLQETWRNGSLDRAMWYEERCFVATARQLWYEEKAHT